MEVKSVEFLIVQIQKGKEICNIMSVLSGFAAKKSPFHHVIRLPEPLATTQTTIIWAAL